MSQPATAALASCLADLPTGPVAVAVSGGSDSMALMVLAADWAQGAGRGLQVITVDHGLRPEAAEEARWVAAAAGQLGLTHHTVTWQGWDGQGNLQDQARRARYALMADWAEAQGVGTVLLGHTADDLAETLMMRLARGAGVDGLSAMAVEKRVGDTRFLRPLLGQRREDLRDLLRARRVDWVEDPSNQDRRFDRVRVRQALASLAEIDLTPEALTRVGRNMADAREALNWSLAQFAGAHVQQIAGDLAVDHSAFLSLPDELARRLLGHAVRWIGGAEYPPRGGALDGLVAAARQGRGATLQGVRMTPRRGGLHLHREYAAARDLRGDTRQRFDHRWCVTGPHQPDLYVAPLGPEGLRHCPGWRDSGRPAAAHHADPAIWQENRLVSAPLAGKLQGWQVSLQLERADFINALLSR